VQIIADREKSSHDKRENKRGAPCRTSAGMVEEEDRGHGAWAAATARAVEVRSLYDLLARCRPRLAAAGHSGEIQTTWWILVYLGVRHSWRDPIVVRWGLLQHNVKVSGVCVLLKYRGGKEAALPASLQFAMDPIQGLFGALEVNSICSTPACEI